MPMEYHMTHIWGSALTEEDLSTKFRSLIDDSFTSNEKDFLVTDLQSLKAPFYLHEFAMRLILKGIESDNADGNGTTTN
jgi:hypothetical protein